MIVSSRTLVVILLLAGCSEEGETDVGTPADAGVLDAATNSGADAAAEDATVPDAGTPDTGSQQPPPLPVYSGSTCPVINGGPTAATSTNAGFVTGSQTREFRLLVPDTYDGTEDWPLVFSWHWLNASSGSFVRDGELESAIEEMGFIAVLPDRLEKPNGDHEYLFDWPFIGPGSDEELQFFDDLYACVAEQYRIDRQRVYAIGVSAGGLWVTYLSSTDRVDHFAAVISLSGGLGEVASAWRMEFTPRPHRFPALVLWGGPNDWLGVNFHNASQRYLMELMVNGHYAVRCTHDAGHSMPPVSPPAGSNTKFWMLWKFMLDHPYSVPYGTSPYDVDGLPVGFPEWCEIAQ